MDSPITETDQVNARQIDALSASFVEESCRLDPLLATYLGVEGYDGQLPDLSPDGWSQREALVSTTLRRARALDPVDERERIAKEALLERLELTEQLSEQGYERREMSVISSFAHAIRECFDLMTIDTDQGRETVSSRLAAIPEALAGYRQTLQAEADAGRVSAQRQYREIAEQIRRWTGQSGEAGNFFTDLVSRTGAEGALRATLDDNATAASQAYVEFEQFMTSSLLPVGRENEACGLDEYQLRSRYFLGAEIDLDETYAWGWQELKRIHDDIVATADRILPGATPAQAVAALDADPAQRVEGREVFREWMQELADRTIAELNGVHFDIPEQVQRIECCLAPTNEGGIYYTGPSEDFSRPGRMWWSVPDGIETFYPWRETTTVYHEGVPGHHLQVGQTAVRSELLNRWQRQMCWVSGHGEGWALYSERLMDELGYLEDPATRMGMLDAQQFRAARVIVDIGMHLEKQIPADNPFGFHPGETWTPALGREFMGEHCFMEPAFIDFEVARYLGWPGQAPSYKVGERIWLQARDEAKQRAGATFDLKTFHRQALDLGSLGLDPLRDALARL